jgi:hypothetical protein
LQSNAAVQPFTPALQVVLFLYSTRILLYLVRVALDCKQSYIAVALSEATTLVFFLTAGWKFRPRPENP